MFPRGGPGLGLLFLRMATAAMFALNVMHPFLRTSPTLYWVGVSLIILITFLLCIGFLTPFVSAVACLAAIANFVLVDQPGNFVYILRILTSAALFFLGPGAYSLDARLFGLRVTVVPPRKNNKSATTLN
jgi:uncharacterized membrane protein YphA (DoxX/SURF4 family)